MSLLSKWFRSTNKTANPVRRSSLRVESLEDRRVLSTASTLLHNVSISVLNSPTVSTLSAVNNTSRNAEIARVNSSRQYTSVLPAILTPYAIESDGVLTCYSSSTGTHTVSGPILEKYKQLGGVNGFLGYPKSDVTSNLDFVGSHSVFQNGTIEWSPATGAHEIHGTIRDLYVSLGSDFSLLGYPVSDQHTNPDGWNANEFEHGSIISKYGSGTHLYFSRTQMISAIKATEQDGILSKQEFDFLHQAATDANVFMSVDVRDLTHKLIDGDRANAFYQGKSVGNLAAGSSAQKVDLLEKKWFEGSDHPVARDTSNVKYKYEAVDGVLFSTADGGEMSGLDSPATPFASDVAQGNLGDCYFLASLEATANKHPDFIRNMFIDNRDGTYAVRFFHGTTPEYVTVDRMLPVDSKGKLVFDGIGRPAKLDSWGQQHDAIWVELAEKAYAQINESGWLGEGGSTVRDGTNSYAGKTGHSGGGIDNGDAFIALSQITGWTNNVKAIGTANINNGDDFANAAIALLKAGFTVVVDTGNSVTNNVLVTKHSYVLLSATNDSFVVMNPWGKDKVGGPAMTTLTRAEFIANFDAINDV